MSLMTIENKTVFATYNAAEGTLSVSLDGGEYEQREVTSKVTCFHSGDRLQGFEVRGVPDWLLPVPGKYEFDSLLGGILHAVSHRDEDKVLRELDGWRNCGLQVRICAAS